MDKVIIAFLRKEPMTIKNANTDGYKLFCFDTCVGQWKEHSVLLNNTEYDQKEIDDFITELIKWAHRSDIIYRLCSKPVPETAKELKSYE